MHPILRAHARRGSALSLVIVVSVVLSSLVAALAWVAGTQAQATGALAKMDQAFFAAETGAQRTAYLCKNGQLSGTSGTVSGNVVVPMANGSSSTYKYDVTWTLVTGSSAINLTSKGYSTTDPYPSYTLTETVTPPAAGVPGLAAKGNFDNKNITINGNLMIGGYYNSTGNGSLNGDLIYGTTVSNTDKIHGTWTQGSFVPIDFTVGKTFDKKLTSPAVGISQLPGSVVDFTKLTGNKKVIYIDGDVTDPTIINSATGGTLYVRGALKFTNKMTIGTLDAPIYLVATGDITFTSVSTVNGAIYTDGAWNRAQITVNGLVYIGSATIFNSGSSTLNLDNTTKIGVPWFDPRGTAANKSVAVTTVSNFTGPLP